MRERRELMLLAGQLLQQGPLRPATLADFTAAHELSAEEVAVLQSEVVTNIVTMFSAQQVSAQLNAGPSARPRKDPGPAVPFGGPTVPTLDELPQLLAREALARGAYRAGEADPYDASSHGNPPLDRLYAFPYDPMAAGRVKAGGLVRYYYPGPGLDLTAVDHVAYVDDNTGVLLLSSSKMIPVSYVTALVGAAE